MDQIFNLILNLYSGGVYSIIAASIVTYLARFFLRTKSFSQGSTNISSLLLIIPYLVIHLSSLFDEFQHTPFDLDGLRKYLKTSNSSDNIDHVAHAGGALFGGLVSTLYLYL